MRMDIKITASCEINGEPYSVMAILNAKYVSEEMIRMSFIGDIGNHVGLMLIGILRTKRISDMRIEKGGE